MLCIILSNGMFQPIGHATWCFKTVFRSYSLLHSFNTYLANAHYMPSTALLCFSLKAPSQATKVFFPDFWRHIQNYWHQWQPWRGRQLVSSFHQSLRLSVTSISRFLTSSPFSSKSRTQVSLHISSQGSSWWQSFP